MTGLRRIGGAVTVFVGVALLPLLGGKPVSAAPAPAVAVTTPYLASVAMASTPDGYEYWLMLTVGYSLARPGSTGHFPDNA